MSTIALQIARLRANGCKVSTILGHDPRIGDFLYKVRIPNGVPLHYTRPVGGHTLISSSTIGGRFVIVRAVGYEAGRVTPSDVVNACHGEAIEALAMVADHVANYDRTSSASVQHFIDTGRYLTHRDIAEGI